MFYKKFLAVLLSDQLLINHHRTFSSLSLVANFHTILFNDSSIIEQVSLRWPLYPPHGFSWTMMSNQPGIISSGMYPRLQHLFYTGSSEAYTYTYSSEWRKHCFLFCFRLGSNPKIANQVSADVIIKRETLTIADIFSYMSQEYAKVKVKLYYLLILKR